MQIIGKKIMTQLHPDDINPQDIFWDDNPFHLPSIVVDAMRFDKDRAGDEEYFASRPLCSKCKHYSVSETGDGWNEPREIWEDCSLRIWDTVDEDEVPSMGIEHYASRCDRYEYLPPQEEVYEIYEDMPPGELFGSDDIDF